jgi:alkylhydroperoxidase/carboxymuconolactone decarboxylase family protein YurZ
LAQNYNDTIHKMQTPFEMRAGLPKKEPKMLEDWEQNHVYEQMIKNNEGKPQYILHDGPPYANGNIHMGTALNKIIKDIIIRYKNMSGFQAPYVPGYDTHGLPIELKALSSLGDKKAGVSKLELRQICKEFATEHIGVMNEQFKRLGVQGDFENPYLTLRPEFEARQVEIFGENMRGFAQSGPEETRHINKWLADNCFGDYYTRGGLDTREREMVTLCFLAAQGGCEPQLTAHAKANMVVGNEKAFLIAVVSQCMPYIGYPRTLNAIRCIDEAVKG